MAKSIIIHLYYQLWVDLAINNSILKDLDSLAKNKKIVLISELTQTRDEKTIEKMISLFDDDDITIRGEVFSALFLNENNISKKLIQSLDKKSKNVKAFCSLILANRNDENAIDAIIKLTDDNSTIVRSCAFGALGHLRAKNARDKISQGIFDSNIEVKKSAAYALVLINEAFSTQERIELETQEDPDFKNILKNYN